MKVTILVVLLSVLAATNSASVSNGAASRRNLSVGNIGAGDRLLLNRNLRRNPIPNAIQSEDLVYRGNATTRITAIRAIEVGYTQYATPSILSGGVGFNNATLRITSYRSYGYNYQIDIYGR